MLSPCSSLTLSHCSLPLTPIFNCWPGNEPPESTTGSRSWLPHFSCVASFDFHEQLAYGVGSLDSPDLIALTIPLLSCAPPWSPSMSAIPVPNPGRQLQMSDEPFSFNPDAMPFSPMQQLSRTEGCATTVGCAGAEPWISALTSSLAAKQHGSGQPDGCGPSNSVTRKRRLFRACRRALHQGGSWYKGQLWKFRDLPHDTQRRAFECTGHVKAPPPPAQSLSPHGRLSVVQWNCSGLSTEKYHELLLWLDHMNVDVGILCETHWSRRMACWALQCFTCWSFDA